MQSTLIKNKNTQIKVRPLHPLIISTVYFLGLALLLAVSALVIRLEVTQVSGNIGENSLVEYLQESYLFIAGSLFTAVAVMRSEQRGFAFLASALFYTMLIRELDGLLDQINHGFWKYPAWLLATSAIGYASLNKKTLIEPLTKYVNHESYGLMLAGILILLVFSRIYGMGDVWQGIMKEGYMRSVKNLAEEGVELLAYSLIVFSAAWYCFSELLKTDK